MLPWQRSKSYVQNLINKMFYEYILFVQIGALYLQRVLNDTSIFGNGLQLMKLYSATLRGQIPRLFR